MSKVTVLPIDAIVSDPAIRSGRPIIAGTTLRVQDVAVAYLSKGYTLEELLRQYPRLTLTKIHAALAYYYAHQSEIDAQIEADIQFFEEAKEQGIGQRHPPVLR
ncbi:MAG: DUF433 domain-containing protein [Anaerolineae bacterium]|nr:DUF433 domain-containing protein [Anaerolineae bacterium]